MGEIYASPGASSTVGSGYPPLCVKRHHQSLEDAVSPPLDRPTPTDWDAFSVVTVKLPPDRLPYSLLREGAEKLGYELKKRVLPFEGLRRAICRCDCDNEESAVLAARPFGT